MIYLWFPRSLASLALSPSLSSKLNGWLSFFLFFLFSSEWAEKQQGGGATTRPSMHWIVYKSRMKQRKWYMAYRSRPPKRPSPHEFYLSAQLYYWRYIPVTVQKLRKKNSFPSPLQVGFVGWKESRKRGWGVRRSYPTRIMKTRESTSIHILTAHMDFWRWYTDFYRWKQACCF